MDPDERVRKLHHRSSLGESLTPEERAELESWYARLDAEESRLLAGKPPLPDLESERAKVSALLTEIRSVTQKIENLAVEIDATKRRNRELEQLLVSQRAARPA